MTNEKLTLCFRWLIPLSQTSHAASSNEIICTQHRVSQANAAQHKMTLSILAYEAALSVVPSDADESHVWAVLGMIQYKEGDLEGAKSALFKRYLIDTMFNGVLLWIQASHLPDPCVTFFQLADVARICGGIEGALLPRADARRRAARGCSDAGTLEPDDGDGPRHGRLRGVCSRVNSSAGSNPSPSVHKGIFPDRLLQHIVLKFFCARGIPWSCGHAVLLITKLSVGYFTPSTCIVPANKPVCLWFSRLLIFDLLFCFKVVVFVSHRVLRKLEGMC